MKKTNIILLIVGAFIVNTFTQIAFCIPGLTCINPFYDMWSFLAFMASVLGIAIFPIGLSIVISFIIILINKKKQNFLYYFSLLFIIFSLIVLFISYSTYSL